MEFYSILTEILWNAFVFFSFYPHFIQLIDILCTGIACNSKNSYCKQIELIQSEYQIHFKLTYMSAFFIASDRMWLN